MECHGPKVCQVVLFVGDVFVFFLGRRKGMAETLQTSQMEHLVIEGIAGTCFFCKRGGTLSYNILL